ncbi:hypothetical protein E2Q21_21670 [Salmonella enterica subsp. enterica serovar Java]|uniref:Uncharacterized protein n=2 Tax=Salmonella enterica TaxID=28901 RepID=A0A3Z6QRX6_SALEB|nr:hypothetical protein CHC34_28060 [Salmonella enterica]EAB6033039.1 hypothetical protein [Salmonella enterica subsp. enterica serovar Java]EBV8392153.1 hypothetical protein [Salmonella enterica subsp. enterica serovar Virchow]ECA0404153.1 hypothetical protein [Salmonella enterica subsp. enterica serovar Newport]ECC9065756.1 hypothetical protein [Salmonella enterica subsp. diarizonae]ECG6807916.1 hypothetical protein [Salmonella enterica subsp. enterica serovar Muenchen]ECM6138234.1 hypothet
MIRPERGIGSSASLMPCTAAAAASMLTLGFRRVSNIVSPPQH